MSFTANETYGEYKHQLTIDELPNHNHEAYSTVLLRENGDGNILHQIIVIGVVVKKTIQHI